MFSYYRTLMSDMHEFWRDIDGTPYLDDLPLKHVTDFLLTATLDEPLTLKLVLQVQEGSGPERLRHALLVAHREAMDALGE